MELHTPEVKADLAVRLRRIEGQVRGVAKMVDEERDCADILQQMAAARSALRQASLVVARAYAAGCLSQPAGAVNETMLDTLIAALGKLD
jgi:DNA-binding FrmR family transcriptional regulator